MKLEEIARLAGVSRTTASYVINGKAEKHRISAATRDRVMAIVDQYQYRPDPAATSLRLGTSRLIGFVLPDLENQSYARLAKLLEQGARERGYQLIIGCSGDDAKTEMSVVEMLVARKIDALLVTSVLPATSEFYRRLLADGLPVIAIDRAMSDEGFASVVSEDLQGALRLTDSLLVQQPASIGLLGAMRAIPTSMEREQGFKQAISYSARHLTPRYKYGDHFSRECAAALCQEWIDENGLPEAIVTTSYILLEGVLDVLVTHPELMAITRLATFGDHRLLDFLPIKVNALSQQYPLIAEKALSVAMAAIAGEYQPGLHIIPRLLKVRAF